MCGVGRLQTCWHLCNATLLRLLLRSRSLPSTKQAEHGLIASCGLESVPQTAQSTPNKEIAPHSPVIPWGACLLLTLLIQLKIINHRADDSNNTARGMSPLPIDPGPHLSFIISIFIEATE